MNNYTALWMCRKSEKVCRDYSAGRGPIPTAQDRAFQHAARKIRAGIANDLTCLAVALWLFAMLCYADASLATWLGTVWGAWGG